MSTVNDNNFDHFYFPAPPAPPASWGLRALQEKVEILQREVARLQREKLDAKTFWES